MFDKAMIQACIELCPVEFYSLCAVSALMIPLGAVLMVTMAMILVGED